MRNGGSPNPTGRDRQRGAFITPRNVFAQVLDHGFATDGAAEASVEHGLEQEAAEGAEMCRMIALLTLLPPVDPPAGSLEQRLREVRICLLIPTARIHCIQKVRYKTALYRAVL